MAPSIEARVSSGPTIACSSAPSPACRASRVRGCVSSPQRTAVAQTARPCQRALPGSAWTARASSLAARARRWRASGRAWARIASTPAPACPRLRLGFASARLEVDGPAAPGEPDGCFERPLDRLLIVFGRLQPLGGGKQRGEPTVVAIEPGERLIRRTTQGEEGGERQDPEADEGGERRQPGVDVVRGDETLADPGERHERDDGAEEIGEVDRPVERLREEREAAERSGQAVDRPLLAEVRSRSRGTRRRSGASPRGSARGESSRAAAWPSRRRQR